MTRFFVDASAIGAEFVTLDAGDAHHLKVVLKASAGDRIAVLDGTGAEITAILTDLSKSTARAKIVARRELATEASVAITVAQALPKMSDKLEQVLQRGTEIGVARFWCYESARSMPHLPAERHAKRLERCRAIVKTAAEQAHRAKLPELVIERMFGDVVQAAEKYDLALLAYEGERRTTLREALENAPPPVRTVLIVIGPEGGFSDGEAADAARAGLTSVSLGGRILRTETAALVAASQVLYGLDAG